MHTVRAHMDSGLCTGLDLVWNQVSRLNFLQVGFVVARPEEGELLLWIATPIVRRYVIKLVNLKPPCRMGSGA